MKAWIPKPLKLTITFIIWLTSLKQVNAQVVIHINTFTLLFEFYQTGNLSIDCIKFNLTACNKQIHNSQTLDEQPNVDWETHLYRGYLT